MRNTAYAGRRGHAGTPLCRAPRACQELRRAGNAGRRDRQMPGSVRNPGSGRQGNTGSLGAGARESRDRGGQAPGHARSRGRRARECPEPWSAGATGTPGTGRTLGLRAAGLPFIDMT
jgi:hypothetical protein